MIRLALCLIFLPLLVIADPLRVATFNTELSRAGPGLLLRDIERGENAQVAHVVEVVAATRPDVLALQSIDWDANGRALDALRDLLSKSGQSYPYRLHLRPNSGDMTEIDLNGDGKTGGPGDAQGYGTFAGQGGIALLSKFPIDREGVQDFSSILWRDLPDARLPQISGHPFPSERAHQIQRLSSTGHWSVPLETSWGRLSILTFQAGPPVFDGDEDRNGLRNRDEILFWRAFLDGHIGVAPQGSFVLLGGANLDPWNSDGYGSAIRTLLTDRRLQDVGPRSDGAMRARSQGHKSPDELDTVDWPKVGRLRVDNVLPSSELQVVGSGVYWPDPGEPGHDAAIGASRHRLVWLDLRLD